MLHGLYTRSILALISGICWHSSAHATDGEAYFSARALGMGGAQRAIPQSTAGVELNPASLAMGGDYWLAFEGGLAGARDRGAGRLLIVDSLTVPEMAMGLSVDYQFMPGAGLGNGWVENEVFYQTNHAPVMQGRNTVIALAFPINPYKTHFGVSLKTVRRADNGADPIREFTTDVGIYYRPYEKLSVALVGNNLAPTDHRDMPTTLNLGAGLFLHPQLLLAVDGQLDFTTAEGALPSIQGGFEAIAADFLPLRAGYAYRPDPIAGYQNFLTVGMGLRADMIALDYGVEMHIDEVGQETQNVGGWFYHMLSLTLSFGGLQLP